MLRRPFPSQWPSAPVSPLKSIEMSICSPVLMRESLSKLRDILSFSIFDSVEVGSPVRRLTSASVQPWRRRSALRTAPGLAVDFGGEGDSAGASAAAFAPTGFRSAADVAATPASYPPRAVFEKQFANSEKILSH